MRSANERLTFVSAGVGQDSTALIYRLGLDPVFRERWAPGHIIVLFSATGDEHDETDAYVPILAKFCSEHTLQWEHLTFDRGYHPASWRSGLVGVHHKNETIGTIGFQQSCTDSLKIVPIYNFVAEYCANIYGGTAYGKRSLYEYCQRHNEKIRMLIGMTAGEESRITRAADLTCKKCKGNGLALFNPCKSCNGTGIAKPRCKYMVDCVQKLYPLEEIGWDRQACQDYIASIDKPLPPPSLCYRCMWKDEDEILWSWMIDHKRFAEWEADESAKLKRFAHRGAFQNYGVKGANTTLGGIRNERLTYYQNLGWTWDKILAHVAHKRMSHGHCVKSKY